jgi:hypothetical protein
VTADGRRVSRVPRPDADGEGRVEFDLGRLALSLADAAAVDLDALARLELGADGWAGSVDLVAMRAQLADWHAACGAARSWRTGADDRPPPGARRARTRIRGVALERIRCKRQEADYHAVQPRGAGAVPFLERHAWSPYRHLVAALVGGH